MRSNTQQQRAKTRSLSSNVQILLIICGVVFLVAGVTLAVGGVSVSGAIGSVTDMLGDSEQPGGDAGGADGQGTGTDGNDDGDDNDPAPNETDDDPGDTDPPDGDQEDPSQNESDDENNDNDEEETYALPVEVVDQDGEPIDGATVTVEPEEGGSKTLTADNGEVEFERPDGTYRVKASADVYQTSDWEEVVIDGKDAKTKTIDLQQEEEETYSLSGTVTDENESSVDGATVTIEGPGGYSEEITTDADGTYEYTDLEPGDYTVSVTADGYEDSSPKDVVISDSDVNDVDFELTSEDSDDDDDGGIIFSSS